MIETSRRILSLLLDALLAALVALLLSMGALVSMAGVAVLSQGRFFICPARVFPAVLAASAIISGVALVYMRGKGVSPAQKILSFMEKLRSRGGAAANLLLLALLLAALVMLLFLYHSLAG